MSLWIANPDKHNKYIFIEGVCPEGEAAEELMVGAEKYYRHLINYSDHTFCIYTIEKLTQSGYEQLEMEWKEFCPF